MVAPKEKAVRGNLKHGFQGTTLLEGDSLLRVSKPAAPVYSDGKESQELNKRLQYIELRSAELERELAGKADTRDRYAGLFESAPVGYLMLNSQGLIAEINLAASALLGEERSKILHLPFSEFVLPEDVEFCHQYFKQVKRSGMQQSCELTLKRSDGKVILSRLDSRYAEVAGVSELCIVLADVTEQKRKETETMEWRNEMAELKKMQIAAQTAAAIAHELNQPLLAIATYSEAALKLLQAEKPELNKVSKAIIGCERQAQRAGKSIHELLDFLTIKEISAEAFDLNKVISEVINTARSEHELQFESILLLEDGLPPVYANRIHVEKVLFNLLRNGIESMHESDVEQPAITVTVCTKFDANAAQVTIQDNGPGVKEDILHQLFKPFFTTKTKGIGMGLAVSRSLIEANGGQLWIDPQEGPGAIFHLTLPFTS